MKFHRVYMTYKKHSGSAESGLDKTVLNFQQENGDLKVLFQSV